MFIWVVKDGNHHKHLDIRSLWSDQVVLAVMWSDRVTWSGCSFSTPAAHKYQKHYTGLYSSNWVWILATEVHKEWYWNVVLLKCYGHYENRDDMLCEGQIFQQVILLPKETAQSLAAVDKLKGTLLFNACNEN